MTHSSLRVLFVDDEPVTAMVLRQIIAEEGHTVCGIATDSRETLQAITDASLGIVFSDTSRGKRHEETPVRQRRLQLLAQGNVFPL